MLQRHFQACVGCACQALWHLLCTLGFLGQHGLGSQRGALYGCAKVNIQGLLPAIIFEHVPCKTRCLFGVIAAQYIRVRLCLRADVAQMGAGK